MNSTEIKTGKAIDAFRSESNCTQSVLIAFSDDLTYVRDTAMQIASGFGGGMGRLQGTCGAVTGAYMVLGLYQYQIQQDKNTTLPDMIQNFSKKFILMHGSTECRTLLDCDINTEKGQGFVRENDLREKVCESCISNAIRILADLMGKKQLTEISS